jgi:hypothetical protein
MFSLPWFLNCYRERLSLELLLLSWPLFDGIQGDFFFRIPSDSPAERLGIVGVNASVRSPAGDADIHLFAVDQPYVPP